MKTEYIYMLYRGEHEDEGGLKNSKSSSGNIRNKEAAGAETK